MSNSEASKEIFSFVYLKNKTRKLNRKSFNDLFLKVYPLFDRRPSIKFGACLTLADLLTTKDRRARTRSRINRAVMWGKVPYVVLILVFKSVGKFVGP